MTPERLLCKCGYLPLHSDIECVREGITTHTHKFCGTFADLIAEVERLTDQCKTLDAERNAALSGYTAEHVRVTDALAASESRVKRLREALDAARMDSRCLCCSEVRVCLDDCSFQDDCPNEFAEMAAARQHNASIDAALAETED